MSPAESTLEELASRGREGDRAAVEQLVEYIQHRVYGLALRMLWHPEDARDASQEIRSGHITRDEGIALVNRYDGEFPSRWFEDFLEYTQLTEERFWEVVDGFRPPHLWEKVNGQWRLKHPVS